MREKYTSHVIKRILYFVFSFLFFISLFFVGTTSAQEYGISGEIGITYTDDELKSGSTDTVISAIRQRYRIDYSNFIYKPGLLIYTVGGAFTKEDAKSDGFKSSATGKDYNMVLNFLKDTPYPLLLWAFRQSPASLTYKFGEKTFLTQQKFSSYGIDGGFFFKGLPRIRYTLRQDERKTSDHTPVEEKDQSFTLSIGQDWKNSSATLNYGYRNIRDNIKLTEKKSHDIQISGNTWKSLSNISHINANAEFRTNTFTKNTEIRGATTLNYFPSGRLYETFTAGFSHINLPKSTSNNFLILMHATYKLSNVLTTTGDGSFFYNTGTSGSNITENISGSLTYFNFIGNNLSLAAGTSLGLGAQQGEPVSKTTISTGLSSVINKNYPALRTNISLGGAAYYYTSSAGGKNENFYMDFNASSQLIERLSATQQFKYIHEKTMADTIDSVPGVSKFIQKFVSDTSLSYNTFVTADARVDLKTGILIEQGQANTPSTHSYYADETLNYYIVRNLALREYLRYQYSSMLSAKFIFFSLDLNYRIRSVFINLRYNRQDERRDGASSNITRLFLELVRPF